MVPLFLHLPHISSFNQYHHDIYQPLLFIVHPVFLTVSPSPWKLFMLEESLPTHLFDSLLIFLFEKDCVLPSSSPLFILSFSPVLLVASSSPSSLPNYLSSRKLPLQINRNNKRDIATLFYIVLWYYSYTKYLFIHYTIHYTVSTYVLTRLNNRIL